MMRPSKITAESMRERPRDWVLVIFLVLWIFLVITGGRMPWQMIPEKGEEGSNNALRQMIFTGAAGLAMWRLLCAKSILRVFRQHTGMVALAGCVIASSVWSESPSLSFKRSIILAFGLTLLMTAVHTFKRPFATMQRLLVYSLGFAVVGSIMSMSVFPRECWELPLREGLAGWTLHPNTLGPICGIGLIVGLGTVPRNRKERVLLWILRPAFGVGLALTGSMTSIAFTVQGLIIYAVLLLPNHKRASAVWIVVVGLVSAYIIGFAEISAAMLKSVGRDPTLTGRTELWAAVLENAWEHPVLGEGYGAFWRKPNRGRELVKTWNPRQSHNGYIDVFNELGFMGLGLLILNYHVVFLLAIRRFRWPYKDSRRRMLASACSTCIVVTCIYSFGETCLMKMDTVPFFAATCMVLVLSNRDTNNDELLPMVETLVEEEEEAKPESPPVGAIPAMA